MTEQPESPDLSGAATTPPPPAGPPSYPYAYPPAPPGAGYQGYQGAYPGAYPPPPMPYGDPYAGAPAAKRNGLGTAALIVGLLAVFPGTCTVIFGVVLGVIALVLGFIARGRVTRGEADNGGTALGGILLGGLAILVSVAFIVLGLTVFKNAGISEYFDCVTNASGDQAQTDQCTSEFKQRVQNLQTTAPRR
jgi:hypothetical protein